MDFVLTGIAKDDHEMVTRLKRSRDVPGLIHALRDPVLHDHARIRALSYLGDLGDATALPVLVEATHSRDDQERSIATRSIGRLGDRSAVARLLELLASDPAEAVRAWAAHGLAELKATETIPILREHLGSSSWQVRGSAARALARLNAPDAAAVIRRAMKADRAPLHWIVYARELWRLRLTRDRPRS